MSEGNRCQQCGISLDAETVDTFCPVCSAASRTIAELPQKAAPDPDTIAEQLPGPAFRAGVLQPTECLRPVSVSGSDISEAIITPSSADSPKETPPDRNVTADFSPSPAGGGVGDMVTRDHPREAPDDGARSGEERPLRLDFLTPCDNPDLLGMLDKYEITGVIGRGGMGIVLRGRDPLLNRVVAVKVLARELASNATARKRFVREGQTAASVKHDNVVSIHAVEPGEKQPFLVMKYIDGPSLLEKLEAGGPLPVEQIVRAGHEIALGLAAAHANNLVHRDIKPSNILLENPDGIARITDFGLARAIDDVGVTKTGVVTGTPEYMSPEQARGERIDHRSDLFSLGGVLYAACTGRSPFRAKTPLAAIRRVCDDTPRPIREVNPDVPDWLVEIIDRLLEKIPDRRFQTAAEVAGLLGRHLAHLRDPRNEPRPDRLRKPRRKTGRRVLIAAALLVLLLGVPMVTELIGWTHLIDTVASNLYEEDLPTRQTMGPGNEAPKDTPPGDNGGAVVTPQDELQKQAAAGAKRIGDAQKEEQRKQAEAKRKSDARGWFAKAEQLTKQRAWKEAALAYQKGFELDPSSSLHWVHCAPLWLAAGDVDGYQAHCRQMLARFEQADPLAVARIAEACQLSAASAIPESTLLNLSTRAMQTSPVPNIHAATHGITLFRLGKFPEACAQIETHFAKVPPFLKCRLLPVMAMAQAQQGFHAKAYQALGEAKTLLQTMDLNDATLMGELLLREAQEKLLPVSEPLTLAGTLTAQDPKDPVKKTSYRKTYPVNLHQAVPYLIDLEGTFDPILRIEDGDGRPLAYNDDVNFPNLYSRIVFLPPATGTYQLVVTSFDQTAIGSFTLAAQKVNRKDGPVVWNGKLPEPARVEPAPPITKTDYFARRLFGGKEITLIEGITTTIMLESSDFEGRLMLLDADGVKDLTRFEGSQSRISISPLKGGKYHVLVTTTKEGQQGNYRLTLESFATPPPRVSTDLWLTRARSYRDQNKPVEALNCYDTAIKLSPQNAALYRERAQFHAGQKSWALAAADLEQALQLEANDFETWRQLLTLLQETGKTESFNKVLDDGLDRFGKTLVNPGASSKVWQWTQAVKLSEPVNSSRGDASPCLSADGLTLLFSSQRPGGRGGSDIWMSQRQSPDAAWGKPVPLGGGVNGPSADVYPSLAADGLTLVFASNREGGQGDVDLWYCTRNSATDDWSAAVNFGPTINSATFDGHPELSADGLTLLFASMRDIGQGKVCLWECTRKSRDEPWGKPVNLREVNGTYGGSEPCLSSDGLTLLFASFRPGYGWADIWMCTRDSKELPWSGPVCLGATINSKAGYEGYPCLSADNNFLIFSVSPALKQPMALWMSRRVHNATMLQELVLTALLVAEPDAKAPARIQKLTKLFEDQPADLHDSPWYTLVRSALALHEGRTEDARQLLKMVTGAPGQEDHDAARFQLFSALLSCRLGDAKTGWISFKTGNDLLLSLAKKKDNAAWVEDLLSDRLRATAEKLAIAQLNEAVAKSPDNADLLLDRGLMNVYLDRFDDAARDVFAVLRKDPTRLAQLDVPAGARLGFATALDQLRTKAGASLSGPEKDRLQKEAVRLAVLAMVDPNAALSPSYEPLARSLGEPIAQELLANHFGEPHAATRLASLLSSWKPFRPTALKSVQGAVLTLQPDGSIVASGLSPERDSYLLQGPGPLAIITGLRLETIPDPSFPGKGAGRTANGNFHLTEIAASFLTRDGSKPLPIHFQQAAASYIRPLDQGDHTSPLDRPSSMIDGKHDGHWDVFPQMQSSHHLVVANASPVSIGPGNLAVELHFLDPKWNQITLGRFRLWVTDAPNPLAALREVPGSGWSSLAWTYMARGQPQQALGILERLKVNRGVSASTLFQLAIARKLLGDDGEARAAYDQAVALWRTEPASADTDSLARHAAWEVAGLPPDQVEWLLGEQRSLPQLDEAVKKGPNTAKVWQDRGRFYAWAGKLQEAAADYSKAIELAAVTGVGQMTQRSLVAVELSQWPELFAEVARGRPNDADMWLGHGRYHILCSQWQKALDAYNKSKMLRPLSVIAREALEYAALLVLVGDLPGYQQFVRETTKTFTIRTKSDAFAMARIVSLAPKALDDPGQAVAWGEKSNQKILWELHTLGLAYYRAGEFQKAIEIFSQTSNKSWPEGMVLSDYGLALAHFRLDQTQQAEQCLARARQERDRIKPGPSRSTAATLPIDWLETEILHRELDALLQERRLRTIASALAGLVGSGWDHPFARVLPAAESTQEGVSASKEGWVFLSSEPRVGGSNPSGRNHKVKKVG